MKTILLLGIALVITGCAAKPTVSEHQCRAGDWQTIGYRDGAQGMSNTRLLIHQEACGAFGIVPEREEYLLGWRAGLENFCTADSGFQLGQRGAAMNNVCRNELREPFASAYADGRALYSARREVNQLSRRLVSHERRLEQIKQEMIGVTTAQLTPDLTVDERLRLLAKLNSLVDERVDLETQLPMVESSLAHAEDRLARLDRSFASR